jgi:hypothetical protein
MSQGYRPPPRHPEWIVALLPPNSTYQQYFTDLQLFARASLVSAFSLPFGTAEGKMNQAAWPGLRDVTQTTDRIVGLVNLPLSEIMALTREAIVVRPIDWAALP